MCTCSTSLGYHKLCAAPHLTSTHGSDGMLPLPSHTRCLPPQLDLDDLLSTGPPSLQRWVLGCTEATLGTIL